MLKYILIILLLYILYRFVFNFLIPVGRATKDLRKKMNEFQGRMQDLQGGNQQGFGPQKEPQKEQQTAKSGDYIDFEEVK